MPCDTIKSYFSILSLYSLQTVRTLSHVNDFSHTHSNSLDQFARASWQSWGIYHSSSWIPGQSFISSYTMAPWNRKTITFSAQLWAPAFLYPDDVSLLTRSWKAGTFRPGGLRHMTKAGAWLFARSGSVGGFYNVWCATILLSVSSYCACVVLAERAILFSMCLSLGYLWQARLRP